MIEPYEIIILMAISTTSMASFFSFGMLEGVLIIVLSDVLMHGISNVRTWPPSGGVKSCPHPSWLS